MFKLRKLEIQWANVKGSWILILAKIILDMTIIHRNAQFRLSYQCNECTVKPVNSSHSRETEEKAVIDRWPLFTDLRPFDFYMLLWVTNMHILVLTYINLIIVAVRFHFVAVLIKLIYVLEIFMNRVLLYASHRNYCLRFSYAGPGQRITNTTTVGDLYSDFT